MSSNTTITSSRSMSKTNRSARVHDIRIPRSIRASASTRSSLRHPSSLKRTLDRATLKRRIIIGAFAWRIVHYSPPFSVLVFLSSGLKAALGECDEGGGIGALLGGFGLFWEGIRDRHGE